VVVLSLIPFLPSLLLSLASFLLSFLYILALNTGECRAQLGPSSSYL
jgi:hypothetical protein